MNEAWGELSRSVACNCNWPCACPAAHKWLWNLSASLCFPLFISNCLSLSQSLPLCRYVSLSTLTRFAYNIDKISFFFRQIAGTRCGEGVGGAIGETVRQADNMSRHSYEYFIFYLFYDDSRANKRESERGGETNRTLTCRQRLEWEKVLIMFVSVSITGLICIHMCVWATKRVCVCVSEWVNFSFVCHWLHVHN